MGWKLLLISERLKVSLNFNSLLYQIKIEIYAPCFVRIFVRIQQKKSMKNRQYERTLHSEPANLAPRSYHLIIVHLCRNPLNALSLYLPICKIEVVILFFPFESLWKFIEITDLWFVHHHSGCMWEVTAIPEWVSENPCLPATPPSMPCSARDS